MRRISAAILLASLPCAAQAASVAVTTYHNDTYRTGWNSAEKTLTAANAASLILQHQVALDAQTDTQPLLVPAVNLGSAGTHDVVYIATANNTLYGIDAESGTVLLSRNFGAPVPKTSLPGSCGNNDATVGITGTPVIDPTTNTLYLIAYLAGSQVPSYQVHAVDITTLADKLTPQTIVTGHNLSNGIYYNFQASYARQRPALVQANGNIYAAFGSFCDFVPQSSRGWVLAWDAATLAPTAGNGLQNRRWASTNQEFLTSIWMAGYGIAADKTGALYFATANSDHAGTSWNARLNLAESVVKLSRNLQQPMSYYTPVGSIFGQKVDDMRDGDVGSGGVMLVPEAPAAGLHLAVAAGKTTPVLLLDRDDMGGRGLHYLASVPSTGCWCGPSYFTGSDKVGRVVLSTGNQVRIFQLQTSPAPKLVNPVTSAALPTGQDPGFFTSVSSNGIKPGTAVVWAITRPLGFHPATVNLVAIDGATGATLLTAPAGTFPNPGGDANLVPTIANGHVYVPSYKSLAIFGLGGTKVALTQAVASAAPLSAAHQVTGRVLRLDGPRMTLRLRDGSLLAVDTTEAARQGLAEVQVPGQPTTVRGERRGNQFVAAAAEHAKPAVVDWPEDF